jgi:hypothetical protein
MTQDALFDRFGFVSAPMPEVPPADSHVTDPPEIERLGGQNFRVLARLRKGPVTNTELATIALKYTSRLSDLRKAGYVISCESLNMATGVTTYRLVGGPE